MLKKSLSNQLITTLKNNNKLCKNKFTKKLMTLEKNSLIKLKALLTKA